MVGWASWTRLWPEEVAGGEAGSSGSIDVSGVDTTNVPEFECDWDTGSLTCAEWLSETGFAGGETSEEGIPYIQVRVPPTLPTDAAKLEAFKRTLVPDYAQDWYDALVFIPVKYDLGQMWRWSVILNRFALAAGNTIGITQAFVGSNTDSYGDYTVFLSGYTDWGGSFFEDVPNIRHTVVLETVNVQAVVDAVPELLPLLGIPVDAVGVVVERRADQYEEIIPE